MAIMQRGAVAVVFTSLLVLAAFRDVCGQTPPESEFNYNYQCWGREDEPQGLHSQVGMSYIHTIYIV